MSIMKMHLKHAIEEEFEDAQTFDEETQIQLTETEQHYARGLAAKSNDVRFNETKIFNRLKGSNSIASILRENLNFRKDHDPY
jgi:hypothetical protein